MNKIHLTVYSEYDILLFVDKQEINVFKEENHKYTAFIEPENDRNTLQLSLVQYDSSSKRETKRAKEACFEGETIAYYVDAYESAYVHKAYALKNKDASIEISFERKSFKYGLFDYAYFDASIKKDAKRIVISLQPTKIVGNESLNFFIWGFKAFTLWLLVMSGLGAWSHKIITSTGGSFAPWDSPLSFFSIITCGIFVTVLVIMDVISFRKYILHLQESINGT